MLLINVDVIVLVSLI